MRKVTLALAVLLQDLTLLTTATSSHSIYPREVAIIDGRQYYFSPEYAYVASAIIYCMDANMTLAALETVEEYDAVNAYIQANLDSTYGFWTSGTRQSKTWIWSSIGQKISYFRWAAGQPTFTDYSTQSNIYLWNGLMYDNVPVSNSKFICEQK